MCMIPNRQLCVHRTQQNGLTHLLQLLERNGVLEDGLGLPDDAGCAWDEAEAEGGGGRLEALHAEVAVVHVEGERLELHRAQERHLGVPADCDHGGFSC